MSATTRSSPDLSPPTPPGRGSARAGRSITSLVLLALGLSLLVLAVAAAKSYRDLGRAWQRQAELEGEIAMTRQRIGGLELELERLRRDPLVLERLAREELGLVAEDEILVVLPEDPGF